MKIIYLFITLIISCNSPNNCKTDLQLIEHGKKELKKHYGNEKKVEQFIPYKIVKTEDSIVTIEGTLPKEFIGGVPV